MNAWNGCIATIETVPLTYVHGTRSRLCLIAFSESPSDSTWLENAQADIWIGGSTSGGSGQT